MISRIYIYQINILATLNLHEVICQLYLNIAKKRERESKPHHRKANICKCDLAYFLKKDCISEAACETEAALTILRFKDTWWGRP